MIRLSGSLTLKSALTAQNKGITMQSNDLLNDVQIASPCTANWEAMAPVSDDPNQVRHCEQCQLNVFNLSGMTNDAAEALLANHHSAENPERLCIRLYRRTDGTVLTQDCPVGIQLKHKRSLSLSSKSPLYSRLKQTAASIAIATAIGTFTLGFSGCATAAETPGNEIMGDYVEASQGNTSPPTQSKNKPHVMGGIPAPKEVIGQQQPNSLTGRYQVQQPCPTKNVTTPKDAPLMGEAVAPPPPPKPTKK